MPNYKTIAECTATGEADEISKCLCPGQNSWTIQPSFIVKSSSLNEGHKKRICVHCRKWSKGKRGYFSSLKGKEMYGEK